MSARVCEVQKVRLEIKLHFVLLPVRSRLQENAKPQVSMKLKAGKRSVRIRRLGQVLFRRYEKKTKKEKKYDAPVSWAISARSVACTSAPIPTRARRRASFDAANNIFSLIFASSGALVAYV